MLVIYYIANTGFLIQHGEKKILIDGIHNKKVKPFHSVKEETIKMILNNQPPFDNLTLLLFTHFHWDHFDGYLALEALKAQTKLKLFTTMQASTLLRDLPNYSERLSNRILSEDLPYKECKKFSINDVQFEAISLMHDGDQYKDVVNFSYIVTLGKNTVFHCGDAKPSVRNYQKTGFENKKISLALLDFPYISLFTGRKLINTIIKPQQILLMHLPDKDEDTYNWLKTIHKVVDRYGKDLPKLTLCEEPDKWIVEP